MSTGRNYKSPNSKKRDYGPTNNLSNKRYEQIKDRAENANEPMVVVNSTERYDEKYDEIEQVVNEPIHNYETRERGDAPLWAKIYMNIFRVLYLPIILVLFCLRENPNVKIYACMLAAGFLVFTSLVYKYVELKPCKCKKCGNIVYPHKSQAVEQYLFGFLGSMRMHCPHCLTYRTFKFATEEDLENDVKFKNNML